MKKRREFLTKVLTGTVAASMVMGSVPVSALAVTGDKVAADETYSATAHVTRTEEDEDDEWDEYDVTVNLTVEDGKFSNITVTPGSNYSTENDSYFNKAVSKSKGFVTKLIGQDATAKTIEAWDTVSGATRTSTAIKQAALEALANAEEAVTTPAIDTTELEEVIATAKGKTEADYTEDSWSAFQSALEAAEAALTTAESQDAVDAAKTSLKEAMDNLETKPEEAEESEYTYVYAALSYAEYYKAEGVQAAGSTSSSSVLDTNGEKDKGAFDAVTRATANHGLHRGNFQQDVVIYDTEGNTYEMDHWDGQSTIVLTNGSSIGFNKGTITLSDGTTKTMDHYEILGIKYVPVQVKTSEYEAFKAKYHVVENGGTLAGGFSEQNLSNYTATAAVSEDTNGLKTATMNADGTFSFSARKSGTDSGILGQTLKSVSQSDLGVEVVDSSKFGDFIRVDLKKNYGDLGAAMQSVVWNYYGNGDTVLASYGTKFAADNWMHKSMGIQLGLTESQRCSLPEGYDGSGKWTLTIYALGYEDTTITVQVDADDIHSAHVVSDVSELESAIALAESLNESDWIGDWDSMQAELAEAKNTLEAYNKNTATGTTQETVDEDTEHLMDALSNLKRYAWMNIPYAEFYAAEVDNDVEVDAFTSATLNKTRTSSLSGGSYHVNSDGTDITGVTYPVEISATAGVDLSEYKQIKDTDSVEISVTNRGQASTTTYTGKDALFESASYSYYALSEKPAFYKELTVDEKGNLVFGKSTGDVTKVENVTADLSTESTYGDYQLDLDGFDQVTTDDQVYGVVITTTDGTGYGLRHLENIWRVTELAWCTGFTTSVHNCPTSSAHYESMMGKTIDKVTYYTSKGIYEIDLDNTYVPVKFENTLSVEDASVTSGSTTITATGFPSDYDAVYTVKGLDVSVSDGVLTFDDNATKGSYTLTVSDKNGKYASYSTDFELYTEAQVAAYNNNCANPALVAATGMTDEEFADYIKAITSVTVNGKEYAASGRGATVIITEEGTIDVSTTPFADDATSSYEITVKATGYQDLTFTYTPQKYQPTYVWMNIPYDEFYAKEVKNEVAVDVFTSATKSKTKSSSLAGGSYHENAEGDEITGVTYPVKVAEGVDVSNFTQVTDDTSITITTSNKGNTSTTTYTGKDALFESASYSYYEVSEEPSFYKELTVDKDGNLVFGKSTGTVTSVANVTADLTTESKYGDYEMVLDGFDEINMNSDQVYGVVISTKEGDSYGLRHLENIWRVTDLAWCTGFTTSVHNCPTSSDHYASMMGQTINKVTYYTSKGIYEMELDDIYVPVKFEYTLDIEGGNVSDGATSFTLEGLPEDFVAEYAVEGLEKVAVSANTKTRSADTYELTFDGTSAQPGSYTLTITDASGTYASISGTFVLSTDTIPAEYNENSEKPAIEKTEDSSDADFANYLSNITSVSVNETKYETTGRNAVVIVKEDGSIDTTTAPFAEGERFEITISSTGYEDYSFVYITFDVAALEEAIATAEALNESDYTADSWKALAEALAVGKDALEAKESKTAVDTATTNLLAAINALVEAEDNSDKKDPADGTQNPSTGTQNPSTGNDSTTGNNNAATGTTNTATGNQTTNATNTGNTTNTDTTKTTGTTIRSNSPKTGDASVLNWLGLAIASVAAGGFTWRKKK